MIRKKHIIIVAFIGIAIWLGGFAVFMNYVSSYTPAFGNTGPDNTGSGNTEPNTTEPDNSETAQQNSQPDHATDHKPTHEYADAIIVLTGGANRINAGLDLLDEQRASYLFISGTDQRVTTEKLLSIWGKTTDKPPCCVVLGYKAKNTKQNATEAYEWIKDNNIKSIILVTSYYHMPRAKIEFFKTLEDTNVTVYPVGFDGYSKIDLKGWGLLAGEYTKFIGVSISALPYLLR